MTGLRTQLLLDFLSFVVVRRQIKQSKNEPSYQYFYLLILDNLVFRKMILVFLMPRKQKSYKIG